MVEEQGGDFGVSCKVCEHDLLHHVGHGECYKNKHTTRRCKCKKFEENKNGKREKETN